MSCAVFCFFFKQKTAYEVVSGDWSSDVCSSDLARTSPAGELVLLADQERSLWNRDQIAEGLALVERALSSRRVGPYTLQAAIAAVHAEAPRAAATNWDRIVGFYEVLARVDPSPVVDLNLAVAIAMRDGPAAGL